MCDLFTDVKMLFECVYKCCKLRCIMKMCKFLRFSLLYLKTELEVVFLFVFFISTSNQLSSISYLDTVAL